MSIAMTLFGMAAAWLTAVCAMLWGYYASLVVIGLVPSEILIRPPATSQR